MAYIEKAKNAWMIGVLRIYQINKELRTIRISGLNTNCCISEETIPFTKLNTIIKMIFLEFWNLYSYTDLNK
jgi:hypothetical protein